MRRMAADQQDAKLSTFLPPIRGRRTPSAVDGVEKIGLLKPDFLLIPGRQTAMCLPLSYHQRHVFDIRKGWNRLTIAYKDLSESYKRRNDLECKRSLLLECREMERLKTRLTLGEEVQRKYPDFKICTKTISELRSVLERVERYLHLVSSAFYEEILTTLLPLLGDLLSDIKMKCFDVYWRVEDSHEMSNLMSCAVEYSSIMDDICDRNEKRPLKTIVYLLSVYEHPHVISRLAINASCVLSDLLHYQALYVSMEITRFIRDGGKEVEEHVRSLSETLDCVAATAVKCLGGDVKALLLDLCRHLRKDRLTLCGYCSKGRVGCDDAQCTGCSMCVKGGILELCVVTTLCGMLRAKQDLLDETRVSWLSAVYSHMQLFNQECNWDKRFCHVLGVAASDKCLPSQTNVDTPTVLTSTTHFLLNCFDELKSQLEVITEHLSKTNSCHCLPTLNRSVLVSGLQHTLWRLCETLRYAYLWLLSKSGQSLSTWNVSKMILLIYCDLPVIQKKTDELKTVIESVSNCGHFGYHHVTILGMQLLDKIMILKTEFQDQFECDCHRMCHDFWHQAFPSKKIWRHKAKEGINAHSEYIDSAILQLLYPFLSGLNNFPLQVQSQVLTTAVTVTVETLKQHVFERKIIFSVNGARQLQTDVCHMRDWLIPDNCDIDNSVCVHLQQLPCFADFSRGISLLLQQPHSRTQSRLDSAYPESCSSLTCSDQGTSDTLSADETCNSSRKDSGVSQESAFDHDNGSDLSDAEKWVRLRLHGSGRPNWKHKLNCFHSDSDV